MIIVLKPDASESQVDHIIDRQRFRQVPGKAL